MGEAVLQIRFQADETSARRAVQSLAAVEARAEKAARQMEMLGASASGVYEKLLAGFSQTALTRQAEAAGKSADQWISKNARINRGLDARIIKTAEIVKNGNQTQTAYQKAWPAFSKGAQAAEKSLTALNRELDRALGGAENLESSSRDLALGWQKALEKMTADLLTWEDVGYRSFQGIYGAFTGLFTDMFLDTEDAFENFADNLFRIFVNMLAKMAAQQLMINVSGLLGLGGSSGSATGFNLPTFGLGNLVPDSVLNTSLVTYGGVGGLELGASSAIVTPAMEAAGLSAGTSITLGSILPYVGAAAGIFGLLGSGLLDDLFGSNAGWGFQTPETTAGFGQMPWNPADFWTAEGSDGTSLEDMAGTTTALVDAVETAINETADEIEGLGDIMSAGVRDKFLAALDGIEITLPQFGVNEENFSEMINNVAGYVRDEMLRQAAPAIGDALAAQWGTNEWLTAIPAMSDTGAVRADYEALLVAYQKMRAEVDAYGQATVETVEEMIDAARTFNETLEESVGWIKDGMADALKDALAEGNLADGMAAFKTSFRQTIYDAMLSGMIEAAVNSAMLEPYMAAFAGMLEDAFAEPTVDAITDGLNAAVSYWDEQVQPRADALAETLYNAVSGSGLTGYLDDAAASGERQSGLTYKVIDTVATDYSDQLQTINKAVQSALYSVNDLAENLAGIDAQWREYKDILVESGHWAYDPEFARQFTQAWETVRQAAIDDAWSKIVDDYKEAMGTADDLSSTIADINEQWDENIETLTVAAEALGLTTEALQQWIDAANTARETAIASAQAEQAKAVIQSQRDLAQYFPGYDANARTIANIAQDYGIAVETITAEWIQNVMKYFMGLPASGAGSVAEIFGNDWEEVADDIAALGQVLKNLTDQAATAYQSMQSALGSALDTQYYQAYLAGTPGGTRGSYLLDVLQTGQADLLSKSASGDMGYTLDNLVDAASLVSQWYTQAVSEAETAARTWAQVTENAQSLVDAIGDLITDIKYSDLNVALPNQKALAAVADYETLKQAALAGGTADIQAFMDFAQTYLETSKAALGSGVTYQDRYAAVMADLEMFQGMLSAGDYDQAIYNELTAQTETVHADLTEINASLASFMDTLDYLFALKTGGLDVGGTGGIDLGDLGTSIDTEGVPQGGGNETPSGTSGDVLAWLEGPFATWMGENVGKYLANISQAYATGGYLGNISAAIENINNIVNGNYTSWGSAPATVNIDTSALESAIYSARNNIVGAVNSGTAYLTNISAYSGNISGAFSPGGYISNMADYTFKAKQNMASIAGVLGAAQFWATGGIVTTPRMGVVGEAGPEAIIPINPDYSLKAPVVVNGEATGGDTGKMVALLEAMVRKQEKPGRFVMQLDDGTELFGMIRKISDDQSYKRDVRLGRETKRLL